MYNWQNIKGVIPALITPFDENGSVDEKSLRALVGFLVQKEVNGFYINGSTSEGFLMTSDERMRVLEVVLDQVNGRVPVINQIGAMQLSETVKMAKHSEKAGADGISSVAPFYYSFRQEEIKDYYNMITESCELPLFIYNIPATTGINLSYDFIKDMSENPKIIGLKYTSYNHYDMMKIKEINDGKFIVFSGADEMCLGGLIAGANALIGSFYNLVPELYIKLVNDYESGRIEDARILFAAGNDIIRACLRFPALSALKAAMKWRNVYAGVCKKPFRQLDEHELKAFKEEIINIERRRNTGLDFFKELV